MLGWSRVASLLTVVWVAGCGARGDTSPDAGRDLTGGLDITGGLDLASDGADGPGDDANRSIMPIGDIATGLHVEGSILGPARPAVASDGTNFLVVQALNTGSTAGGLQGVLVGPDGKTIRSMTLTSDSITAFHDPAVVYGGGHYLIFYSAINRFQSFCLFIAPDGTPEGPPYSPDNGNNAAALAYGGGWFFVARASPTAAGVDLYDHQCLNGALASPYLSTNADAIPAIAFDGTNFLLVWATQEAPNGIVTAKHVVAGRLDGRGQPLDSSPIVLSDETGFDESLDVIFAGDHYVVTWGHRPSSASLDDGTVRAARVGADGTLLDGAPAPAGGHAISMTSTGKGDPRVGLLGDQALVVWAIDRSLPSARIVGTRLGADGSPLDTTATIEGLPISGSGHWVLPAIATGSDRTLEVSVNKTATSTWTLGDTLLFPF